MGEDGKPVLKLITTPPEPKVGDPVQMPNGETWHVTHVRRRGLEITLTVNRDAEVDGL